jgi:hypothetical protein
MEIKVRSLDDTQQKSVAEVEQELLDKHEQQFQDEPIAQEEPVQEQVLSDSEDLTEEKVLSYIGKRYNKEIKSFDDLMAERKEAVELPEDVSAYLKYKQETGRGFEDFIKLNKDIDSIDSDALLKEYLQSTEEGLDEDDIDILMDQYRYDEDFDDESTVKKIKIERKKAVAEAKKYFNSQKEKYRIPLESRQDSISDEEKEIYESYKQYIEESKTIEQENERKRQWFDRKTNEVFDEGFKGFEFNINDKKITFNPGDRNELKKIQSNTLSFISKFLDDQGLIKDAVGYHKSLSIAMNPDKFARFFYEQGQADAVEGTMKNIKNIQMTENRAPEVNKLKDGIQVKAVNPDHGKSLKIRSIKRL